MFNLHGRRKPVDLTRRSAAVALATLPCQLLSAAVDAPEVRVVTGADDSSVKQIILALERRFEFIQQDRYAKGLAERSGTGIYIALGPAAFQDALKTMVSGPLLSLFTSQRTFEEIVEASPRHPQTSAIFAETSPAVQMKLVRRLYGRKVLVGVMLTEATERHASALRLAADAAGVDLEMQYVWPGEPILRTLVRLSSAQIILAMPDRKVYNAETMREILEAGYRRNQPLIGFSRPMVEAGAIAGTYATIDDTIAHAHTLLASMWSHKTVVVSGPTYWRVAINEYVARSLSIPVPEAARTFASQAPELRR